MENAGYTVSNIGIVLIFMSVVIAALPSSPFNMVLDNVLSSQLLRWVNWFFPITECLSIAESWLVAVSAYYVVSLLARWIKLVQ